MGTNISEDATYWVANASYVKAPEKLKLNVLDFSRGIRANEINENFDLIKYWIEAERLRIGGWGIVEGFEMTKDLSNYSVHVGPGIIINQYGEEIHVPETNPNLLSHITDEGSWHPQIETRLKIDTNGVLKLRFAMYSVAHCRTITYAPPASLMDNSIEKEFKITVSDTGRELKLNGDIQSIIENTLLIPEFAGQEVDVEYYYLNDRIDGIFLKADGSEYQYEPGLISTSPSNNVVEDYFNRGYYLIGFAYWHVGETIDVEFFCGDRTLRKVFVDKNNVLYLNGKPYKEKTVIYFVEPNPPQENDLWYNIEEEILYIWRPDENGKYGWQVVNDLSRAVVSVYRFSESQNPKDLQSFSFEGHPEMHFIPGMHQLMIIIDQVVIMEDQYTEIYPEGGEGYACGTGFKLKYPLERPSIVEVRVIRSLNTNRKRLDLFSHEAFYGVSNYTTITSASQRIFPVECQYQCFSAQIEVFKNGLRLTEGKEFNAVLINGDTATTLNKGSLCDRFKLTIAPAVNDVITYRILRPVISYSNLKSIVDQYEEIAQECLDKTDTLTNRVNTLATNVGTIENNYGTILQTHSTDILNLKNDKISTSAKLGPGNLNDTIKNGIISKKIKYEKSANSPVIFLAEFSATDYLTVGYKLGNNDMILLIEDNDYTLSSTENGVNLNLNSKWTGNASAKIYVTGLKIGV